MQLVVRVERAEPPSVTAVCEAAAIAVVTLLDDERSQPGGQWHGAVAAWESGRIRKLVRRARGAPWERAMAVDGVTVAHRGAQVHAVVPGPVDELPAALAKLQVAGLALDDADRTGRVVEGWPGLAIAVSAVLDMSPGKRAAQCGHASQIARSQLDGPARAAWAAAGYPCAVTHPPAREWAALVAAADVEVHDGGFTEVPAGSLTAVAWWPSGAPR